MPIIVTDATHIVVGQRNKSNTVITNAMDIPKPAPTASETAKLIVNGKERKIGKKSQYLLDMLTLED